MDSSDSKQSFNTYHNGLLAHAIHALRKAEPSLCTDTKAPFWQKITGIVFLLSIIALLMFNQKWAWLLINWIIFMTLSCAVIVKMTLALIGFFVNKHGRNRMTHDQPNILPLYSILIPLYQENKSTLQSLFNHLRQLIYPRDKLEIKVLLESDDDKTIALVQAMQLPDYIEIISIPASEPRTKAKACNYGLQCVRGEFVSLYDAEDRPDPNQLLHALHFFYKKENENIACLQCQLNFYNSNENWLTRLFTIEYTAWFDLILPVLEWARMPIPLGGTSNHFRADILKKVHGWDPYNVTEDADLGIRLSRLGYRIKMLHSTTYEEANCHLWNWIRQRTRWIKGYMQTYLVHMRHPYLFWKQVGSIGFFGFQLFVGGTIVCNLANIPMWLMSLSLYCFPHWHPMQLSGTLYSLSIFNFYIGTVGMIALNMLGVVARKNWHLILSAFTAPFYWILMSLASYRALYQFIINPSYWEKTEHGISSEAG